MVAAQAEDVHPAAVMQSVVTVVAAGRCGKPDGVIPGLAVPGCAQVADPFVAGARSRGNPRRATGLAGDDVDDAEEGVRSIGDGVGAAHDFDALDFVHRNRQRQPIDAAQDARRIDGPPIDQHLHIGRRVIAEAVVSNPVDAAALLADLHARHQAHQAGDVTVAGGPDQLTIEDGDCGRRLLERLGQAGRGEDDGQFLKVASGRRRIEAILRLGEDGQKAE